MGNILNIDNVNIESLKDKTFLIDTNILLWAFYPSSIRPNDNDKCLKYANFVYQLLYDNHIVITAYNFCEALFVIEKIRYNTFKRVHNSNIRLKQFRKIKDERLRVYGDMFLFYTLIQQFTGVSLVDQTLKINIIKDFIENYNEHLLDFFDYFLSDLSDNNDLPIITDDADFKSKSISSDIYTLNSRLYNHNS